MKRIILYLLLALSVSANAQNKKKLIHFMLAGGGSSSTPSTAIPDVDFTFKHIQRTNEAITLSATTNPNGIVVRSKAVTGYKIYLRFSNASDKVVIYRWY